MPRDRIDIGEEVGAKKAFVWAIDWPGWCRAGKTVELAREALVDYAPRYAKVVKVARLALPSVAVDNLRSVDKAAGGGGTDFGVPSEITSADRRRITGAEAARLASLRSVAQRSHNAHAGCRLPSGAGAGMPPHTPANRHCRG